MSDTLTLLDSLLWLLFILGPLVFLQPRLHREVQAVFLMVTRNPSLTILLFSILFFPGVLLHEVSHFLMAKLLRVRTGRFSVLPKALKDGRLQMGFVEIYPADPLREAMVGAAPLLAGGALVAFAGLNRLGLDAVWNAGVQNGIGGVWSALQAFFQQPDVWLWLYLTITVSSMMFPSASDRRPWLPVGIALAALLAIGLAAGAGGWMVETFEPVVSRALHAAVVVFGIAAGVQAALLAPLIALRHLIGRVFGVRLVQRG